MLESEFGVVLDLIQSWFLGCIFSIMRVSLNVSFITFIAKWHFYYGKDLTTCHPCNVPFNLVSLKVSPIYDPYVGECLLERTLVLSHRLFEVGWPVPFLAAFISPVFPPGPHSLLGGQWASVQSLVLGGSRTVVFATVGKRSNRYATRPLVSLDRP